MGANVTGICGPETNAGGFSSLTFDTAFHDIRFAPPSETGLPGPFGGISQWGAIAIGIPGAGVPGEGTLGAFTLCPMYEGDTGYPSIVTQGPYPFEPGLSVWPVDPDTLPVVPLASTPPPAGGTQMMLVFSIGANENMGPILFWQTEIGGAALGGSLEPVQAPFPVSWEQLARGEEFSLEVITGDEGETWKWTMRFVPSP